MKKIIKLRFHPYSSTRFIGTRICRTSLSKGPVCIWNDCEAKKINFKCRLSPKESKKVYNLCRKCITDINKEK